VEWQRGHLALPLWVATRRFSFCFSFSFSIFKVFKVKSQLCMFGAFSK